MGVRQRRQGFEGDDSGIRPEFRGSEPIRTIGPAGSLNNGISKDEKRRAGAQRALAWLLANRVHPRRTTPD